LGRAHFNQVSNMGRAPLTKLPTFVCAHFCQLSNMLCTHHPQHICTLPGFHPAPTPIYSETWGRPLQTIKQFGTNALQSIIQPCTLQTIIQPSAHFPTCQAMCPELRVNRKTAQPGPSEDICTTATLIFDLRIRELPVMLGTHCPKRDSNLQDPRRTHTLQ